MHRAPQRTTSIAVAIAPTPALGNLRVFKMDVHVVRVSATPMDVQASTSPATNKQQSHTHNKAKRTHAQQTSTKQNKKCTKKML
jgi:hypothetical protein